MTALTVAPRIQRPRDLLLPYQLKWVDDFSRFKIGLMGRQTGKSTACAYEAVEDSMSHDGVDWIILSRGERQALEFMQRAKKWAMHANYAIEDYVEDRESSEALIKTAEITWQNGSRMLALPANPETIVGYAANVIFDEFSKHEKPDEIWRAFYPTITNPLSGLKKVRIISTMNGIGNKFHSLWTQNYQVKGSIYSCHKVTIHDAVAAGLNIDIEELREAMDDPEGFAQEYECEALDLSSVLLSYELIGQNESIEATESVDSDFWRSSSSAPGFLGIDFGRKRDLTASWYSERSSDLLVTKEVLTLANTPTPEQIDILRPRIRKARRVCLDYTGPGIGMGDYLVKEFGQWEPDKNTFGKIELVTMSNPTKVEIFSKLRMSYDKRGQRIPVSRKIREDLHSVSRCTTPTGQITFRAPHNEDGHADRATANALMTRAAGYDGGPLAFRKVIIEGRENGRPFARQPRGALA